MQTLEQPYSSAVHHQSERIPDVSAASFEKEWGSVKEACHFASFSKPFLYDLMDRGLIRNASLRERGKIKGKRLVHMPSLRAFLESRATGGELVHTIQAA